MKKESIVKAFGKSNLPVKVLDCNPAARTRFDRDWRSSESAKKGFFINLRPDGKNSEVFRIFVGQDCKMKVLESDSKIRHLLLLVETDGKKDRYLLGHDERHLFVSSLVNSKAGNIKQAFEELQPEDVRDARNNNKKVIRQGEWFFIPEPGFSIPNNCVLEKKSSIRKVRGYYQKILHPHTADELVRVPVENEDGTKSEEIYVRGKVRHGEHATVRFKEWHRVYRNLEKKDEPRVRYID